MQNKIFTILDKQETAEHIAKKATKEKAIKQINMAQELYHLAVIELVNGNDYELPILFADRLTSRASRATFFNNLI